MRKHVVAQLIQSCKVYACRVYDFALLLLSLLSVILLMLILLLLLLLHAFIIFWCANTNFILVPRDTSRETFWVSLSTPSPAALTDYWKSKDCRNLFAPESTQDIKTVWNRRIKNLFDCVRYDVGYKDVIETNDKDNVCSEANKKYIRDKSMILCSAYKYALQHLPDLTFRECCKLSLQHLNPLGVSACTNEQTVMKWNRIFRKNELFAHPNRCSCG